MLKDLTPTQRAQLVNLLHPGIVAQVYSGKPGCGCGCRGAYRTAGRMVTANLKAMQAAPDTIELTSGGISDTVIFALETATRYRWVYVKSAVVAVLVQQVTRAGDLALARGEGC